MITKIILEVLIGLQNGKLNTNKEKPAKVNFTLSRNECSQLQLHNIPITFIITFHKVSRYNDYRQTIDLVSPYQT